MTVHESSLAEEGTFQEYYQKWAAEQTQLLNEMLAAAESKSTSSNGLCGLIQRVVNHYEEYYKVKSHWAKKDVLLMLTPTWTTPLEQAFYWIGGWRPTMAIHVLYSKSGIQLDLQLTNIAQGISAGNLADIGPSQLVRVDQLQRRTVHEEREISEKMAKQQGKLADSEMVELTHELIENAERVESALRDKEEGLKKILKRADDLRLKTLKGVIEILSPSQALHFLIAAAELHLRLHEWGKERKQGQKL